MDDEPSDRSVGDGGITEGLLLASADGQIHAEAVAEARRGSVQVTICIKIDEFCIKNHGGCIKNDVFWTKDYDFNANEQEVVAVT